jgi:hypothetical protein
MPRVARLAVLAPTSLLRSRVAARLSGGLLSNGVVTGYKPTKASDACDLLHSRPSVELTYLLNPTQREVTHGW